ncbi:MAG: Lsr2 family protein [Actinomycetota bacterium]
MAQKIQVLLICDVCNDDTAGTENIRFGVDGVNYEIDVCDKHAAQLRDAVAPFSGAGRRAEGRPDRARVQAIRAWAKQKGIKVSERGRISAAVAAQYDAAGH